MGRPVAAMLGMILRVRRYSPGVGMHWECANVAEHDKHGHRNKQPGRQTPSIHALETSERPESCQAYESSGTIHPTVA